ncbi:MAG: hypothetical protein KA447_15230, partial [Pyrinomonadaceae bacterium]|nr:hypothetical protein [Pyrinomonadaceae bacterium]
KVKRKIVVISDIEILYFMMTSEFGCAERTKKHRVAGRCLVEIAYVGYRAAAAINVTVQRIARWFLECARNCAFH